MPSEDLHIRVPNGQDEAWDFEFARCSCGWEGPHATSDGGEEFQAHLEAAKAFLREEVYGGPHGG